MALRLQSWCDCLGHSSGRVPKARSNVHSEHPLIYLAGSEPTVPLSIPDRMAARPSNQWLADSQQ